MRDLQENVNMAIMFITHNLGVIAEMAEEITVMYMGKQVERAKTVNMFHDPSTLYTRPAQVIPRGKENRRAPGCHRGYGP